MFRGCLESNFAAIDGMCPSVQENKSNPFNCASCKRPFPKAFLKPFLDGGIELRGNVRSRAPVVEYIFSASVPDGFDETRNACELAGSSGLLLQEVLKIRLPENVFLIVHSGLPRLNWTVVLTLHSFYVDFEVQLSHPTNDSVACILVNLEAKRWVFPCEATHSFRERPGICFHRFHGEADHGLRNLQRLHRQFRSLSWIGERISTGAFHSKHCTDLAGSRSL
mmetsp:Transcript_21397/g.31133  ORF Transcript_21397/g.31133 Transcript_21397/m.31133 type:complete len:223 (-) Transcript_21397:896-1564(-)